MRIDDLSNTDDGRVLIAISEAGLKHVVGDKVETYPIRSAGNPNAALRDRDVNANKLLRDRDGGLWIGTHERGLIHVHHGRTDVFTKADGLSSDIICSLFEDREGNIWVGTTRGLDRFRELPVATTSVKQGLSNVDTNSVLASTDGGIWVATHHGLARLKDGQTTVFHKANGLPDDSVQSLFQDARGRIWAFTAHGLAYFKDGGFVDVPGVPSEEVYSIAGDDSGNLWLSGNKGLSHLRNERFVENFSWSAMGHHQQAKVVVPDQGGVWLAFWVDGGVLYFKDGHVRTSYTAVDGLPKGPVSDLRFDRDGALWAATEEGGLSRIKDGRIATLTSKNGLPCDTIHWSMEDDDRSLWLYTARGLLRVTRAELDLWIADPNHKVETTRWDAADGVILRGTSPGTFAPVVAKATDGKLWFHTGDGIQVVDPRHVVFNKLPPPVHVEQILADDRLQWKNLLGGTASNLRLPPRTHDVEIDYAALSLVAPEKTQFRVKLEGQDPDWRAPVNSRSAHYTNLPPGPYRFRVIASNNSGIWNEQGDALEFSVAPAYYQTNWFRALCVGAVFALLWAFYQLRVRQLHHEFDMTLDARVGERTRIARELHDTLLQSFHGILLHLQTVSNELADGDTKHKLDGVIDQAAHAIVEGRDAVQGLRASTTEGNDLALAIRTLGAELEATQCGARRSNFIVQVEGAPRNLHPLVRDEAYRIAGEGLRNAFRHANAQRIEAEIRYDDRQLRLRVRDDGKGIDPQYLSLGHDGRGGHFGLRGIRERSKLIGGKLTVWSELNSGTEVELSIPGDRAYATAPELRRSGLLAKISGKFSRKDARLKA